MSFSLNTDEILPSTHGPSQSERDVLGLSPPSVGGELFIACAGHTLGEEGEKAAFCRAKIGWPPFKSSEKAAARAEKVALSTSLIAVTNEILTRMTAKMA